MHVSPLPKYSNDLGHPIERFCRRALFSYPKHLPDRTEDTFPESSDGIPFSTCDLLLDDGSGALEIIIEQGVFAPELGDKSFSPPW